MSKRSHHLFFWTHCFICSRFECPCEMFCLQGKKIHILSWRSEPSSPNNRHRCRKTLWVYCRLAEHWLKGNIFSNCHVGRGIRKSWSLLCSLYCSMWRKWWLTVLSWTLIWFGSCSFEGVMLPSCVKTWYRKWRLLGPLKIKENRKNLMDADTPGHIQIKHFISIARQEHSKQFY